MFFTLEAFLFIFARLSGLFLVAPIYSSRQIPARIRIFALLILSGCMAIFVQVRYPADIAASVWFVAALALEVFIGLTMGFVAYMIVSGVQLAGQLMDMQMGFGIVNVVDPISGTQIPLMGNFIQTVALLFFLSINGHHYLLQAIAESYKVLPVLGVHMGLKFFEMIIHISAYMFVLALKVALPLVIAILTADVSMGFIGRTVPQMNVFLVGLPLKIILGLGALLMLLPVYMWVFRVLFERLFGYLDNVIRLMGI